MSISKRRSTVGLFATVAIALLIVTACAPAAPITAPEIEEPIEVPAVAPTEAPPEPEPEPEAEPVKLIYAVGQDAVGLDPHRFWGGPAYVVFSNIYESLVESHVDGGIAPALAESWTLSEDELTWTFKLREGVKFHDGTDFNAAAVEFNFDRVLNADLEGTQRDQWSPFIDTVNVVDDYTVEIVTNVPWGGLLPKLAGGHGQIPSPAAIEQHGDDFIRNPVGTGPFMFDSWSAGERIIVKKNPNYWREGPFIDEIEFRVIPESAARVLALEAGDVDLIQFVPVVDMQRLDAAPDFSLLTTDMLRLYYCEFNFLQDAWVDPNTRIALNFAIDREALVEGVLFGGGKVATSWVSPSTGGIPGTAEFEYDPEKARSMLEEADFDFDQEYTFFATEGRYVQDRQIAEAIQGMLGEIGVKINVEILEWGVFVEKVWFTAWDDPAAMERHGLCASYGLDDPGEWLRQILGTDQWPLAGFNSAFYSNPESDRLLGQINSSANEEDRQGWLSELQDELTKDPPMIILHFEQGVYAHKPEFQNFTIFITADLDLRLVKQVE